MRALWEEIVTRNTKVVLVLFAVIVFGGIVSAWSIAGRGFSAKATPTVVETLIARNVRSFATPRAARDAQNPVTKSEDVLREAMVHYADHCALCHANDGSGVTSIGQGLYPKPPDMRRAETQNLTDGELFYIIHNGIRLTGMPAFGQSAPDQDMDSWKLVHFIRQLPSLTDDDLTTMKAMNPKSRHELEEEEAARRFLAGEDLPSDKHGHH
jgi:mono/diheme cytochrome c family protein